MLTAHLTVFVTPDFAGIKVSGRANCAASPDFKTLLNELAQKGYGHFIIDLSECALMDSTFLGVLAGFGIRLNPNGATAERGIELLNANPRVTDLLENLGVLHLFRTTTSAPALPAEAQACTPADGVPTHEELTRTSLEAHRTLMAMNAANQARFKDVAQFLAEDLQGLAKPGA